MKLVCNGKEISLVNCTSFWSRFRGFMLVKKIDKALLFDRCNSIHTFFMLDTIDVIMCDKNNVILYCYKDLSKNRVVMPKKGVSRVFETPSSYFVVKVGDKLEIK